MSRTIGTRSERRAAEIVIVAVVPAAAPNVNVVSPAGGRSSVDVPVAERGILALTFSL
jgi:hypothetical protein